jgi:hydrogenase nickel incorporation protein HypA/HybF
VHETGLAFEVYRIATETARANGGGRLTSVSLRVGELSAVEPELIVYAWEAAIAGGPDEGARLEVEWRAAEQTCPTCGAVAERAAGSWLRLCPGCETPLRVVGGDELDVMRVTFEEGGV